MEMQLELFPELLIEDPEHPESEPVSVSSDMEFFYLRNGEDMVLLTPYEANEVFIALDLWLNNFPEFDGGEIELGDF